MTNKKFCTICDVMVETCVHFEEPAPKREPTPKIAVHSWSDQDLLSLAQREKLLRTSPLLEDVVQVDTPPPLNTNSRQPLPNTYLAPPLLERVRTILIPFGELAVAGHSTVSMNSYPHHTVQPLRLVYGGAPERFKLLDVMIGRISQFAAYTITGLALENFPPHPRGNKPINNLSGISRCTVGLAITLTVVNVTDRVLPFDALIYAQVIEEKR